MMDFSRKRNFVWLAVLLFCVGCTAAKDRHSLEGKNVLFIVADDLNCSLGCYGDPNAVTPHLDNLAESGVRFEQAHCQYPLCGPSRTSFLTGLYPGQSGVRDNRVLLRDALPEVTTLPQLFRQHGYDVVRVGKLFHYDNPGEIGTSGQDDNPSWDETYNPVGRDKREEHRIHSLVEGKFGGTLSWLESFGDDEEYTDGKVAQIASRKLEEFAQEARPFFLAVGFFRPHTPFVAPSKYFDLHPLSEIQVPNKEEEALERLPLPAQKSVRSRPSQLNVPLDTAKALIQAYRASVSFVDAQVGRVLETLEKTGLDDNTMVIFLSDHGYHLGEHGHWQKQTLFEDATRVPLIVRSGNEHPFVWGSDHPVELVDIYPTVAAWAGISHDPSLPGIALFEQPDSVLNRRAGAYTTWRKGVSLRTENHRITRWGQSGSLGWELYDHRTDSLELFSAATNLDMAPLFDSLSQLLNHVDSVNQVVPMAAGHVNYNAEPLPRTKPLVKATNAHWP